MLKRDASFYAKKLIRRYAKFHSADSELARSSGILDQTAQSNDVLLCVYQSKPVLGITRDGLRWATGDEHTFLPYGAIRQIRYPWDKSSVVMVVATETEAYEMPCDLFRLLREVAVDCCVEKFGEPEDWQQRSFDERWQDMTERVAAGTTDSIVEIKECDKWTNFGAGNPGPPSANG